MARENQGLQIALIIFVILTIILGVTTFIFFKQGEEADIRAQDAEKVAREKDDLARNVLEDNSRLKALMGFPDTLPMNEISDEVNKDLDTYGANFQGEPRGYRQVLEYLFTTVQDRARDLDVVQVQLQELKNQIPRLEEQKAAQLAVHETTADEKAQELAAARRTFDSQLTEIRADVADAQNVVRRAREDAGAKVGQANQKLQEAHQRVTALVGQVKEQSKQLGVLQQGTFEVADGEIRWVNQRNRTVWINLGRADSLPRQTTFSVYPAEATALGPDVKKASVEVTQILGDNMAEARIVEDSSTNPIMPGDKIHTPVWSPGDRRRFALAGLLDATGDGRDDLELVRNLIAANGGVVDAYIDPEKGRVGQITVNTRFLVLGERPDEKGNPRAIEDFTRMVREAELLGIQTIPLGQLLEMMGWQNRAPVERLGEGASAPRLGPRQDEPRPRPSTGNVSEKFRPRTPPRGDGGGAY